MFIKIQTSPLSAGNTGSCKDLVRYLEKENAGKDITEKEFFFSHQEDQVSSRQVIEHIDNNKSKLGKDEAKFYSVVISPSQEELAHLKNDRQKLVEFTRAVMEKYAENFNRGLTGDNLVYYGKLEYERSYKGFDEIPADKKQGDLKEGLQTHIHIIVSRKDESQKFKLSPLANERGTETHLQLNGKQVVKGFDRVNFKSACEELFDRKYDYNRPYEQTFEYANLLKNGDKEQRLEARLKVLESEQSKESDKTQVLEANLKALEATKGIEQSKTPEKDKDVSNGLKMPRKDKGFGMGD